MFFSRRILFLIRSMHICSCNIKWRFGSRVYWMQVEGMPLDVGSTWRFIHFSSIDGDSFQRTMTSRTRRGRATLRNSSCSAVRIRGAVKPAAASSFASVSEILSLTLMTNALRLHPRRRASTLPLSNRNRGPSQEVRAHRKTH